MKALTVQQPWAWAIIHGGKDVENRTQAWSYRGPLAIHAGARLSQRGADSPLVHAAFRRRPREVSLIDIRGCEASGAFIGVVDLVDVHTADWCWEPEGHCSPWAEASWGDDGREVVHLVLENPRPLTYPIPCRGQLALWAPPADVVDAITQQLTPREAVTEAHCARCGKHRGTCSLCTPTADTGHGCEVCA